MLTKLMEADKDQSGTVENDGETAFEISHTEDTLKIKSSYCFMNEFLFNSIHSNLASSYMCYYII